MAKLVITRSSEWNNRARAIGIYVDEQKVGTISNGETKEFDVAPGVHSVKAKIDWAGSMDVPVMLEENDVKTLKLSGFKNGRLLMPVGAGAVFLFYITKMFLFLILAGLMLLVVFYYLTAGRNKYLVLENNS